MKFHARTSFVFGCFNVFLSEQNMMFCNAWPTKTKQHVHQTCVLQKHVRTRSTDMLNKHVLDGVGPTLARHWSDTGPTLFWGGPTLAQRWPDINNHLIYNYDRRGATDMREHLILHG